MRGMAGATAVMSLDQTFFNHVDRQLEGRYSFPLPSDAAISRLAMYVDGRLVEGGIVEVCLATNPDLEGEGTARVLAERLEAGLHDAVIERLRQYFTRKDVRDRAVEPICDLLAADHWAVRMEAIGLLGSIGTLDPNICQAGKVSLGYG